MEIDRNRFQRKASLSRGTSVYVSSGSWAAGQVSLPPQQQSDPTVPPGNAAAEMRARREQYPEEAPVVVAPPTQQHTQEPVPHQPLQSAVTAVAGLLDDDAVGFGQWALEESNIDADPPPEGQSGAHRMRAIPRHLDIRKHISVRWKVLKPALFSVGIVMLFCGSVALGFLSSSGSSERDANDAPAVGERQNAPASGATANGTSTGLVVDTAASGLSIGQNSDAQMQGTTRGLDVRQYSETYKGGTLNITVQPLPDNYKSNPQQTLKDFAGSLKATGTVQTSHGPAYILTANGVQVVVFVTDTKLVMFQSLAVHGDADWVSYINAMKL